MASSNSFVMMPLSFLLLMLMLMLMAGHTTTPSMTPNPSRFSFVSVVSAVPRYRSMGPYDVRAISFSTTRPMDSRLFYPIVRKSDDDDASSSSSESSTPPPIAPSALPLPVIGFVLPTYGDTPAGWTKRNEALANHIASHGFAVVSSLSTGGLQDEGRTRVPGRYSVNVYLDAPVHTLQMLQRIADISVNRTITSKFDSTLRENDRTLNLLAGNIDVYSMGIAGYSVGGAGAMWTLELAEERWPGHVVAAMILAPAIGREGRSGNGARSLFVRGDVNRPSGLNISKPLLLMTGSNDNMGGVDGVRTLYKSAIESPRVMLELQGATHCFIPFEVANECTSSSWQQQVAAAEHAVAFFRLYLREDMNALPAVWGKELIEGSSMPLSTVWRSSAGPLPEGWMQQLKTSGERRAPEGWSRLEAEAQVRSRAVDAITESALRNEMTPPELAAAAATAAATAAERAIRGPLQDLGIDEQTDEIPWWVPLPLRIVAQVGEFVGDTVEEGVNAGVQAAYDTTNAVIAG